MKILLISNSNSPKRKIADEFEDLGHEVDVFLCRPYARGGLRRKLTEKMPGYTRVAKMISKVFVNRNLEDKISEFKPDLIIGDKAEMIYSETLEKSDAEKLLWFPDDPQLHGLGKELSKGYDKVLTNSKCVLESYDTDSHLLPFPMADEELYGDRKKKYDICFIGRCDEKRERYMKVAVDNFEDVFIGGPEWDESIEGAEVENRWISQEEMIEKYEESRIIINIAKTREHVTHRIFEAGAADSVVLTERLSGLREFYSEDEMPCFEDPREMLEITENILAEPKLSKKYRSNSRKKTKSKFNKERISEKILNYSTR